MTISERIKQLRTDKGISRLELAIENGFSQGMVCNWEKGVFFPSLMSTITLADFFEVSLDYLVGREECSLVTSQQELELAEHEIDRLQADSSDAFRRVRASAIMDFAERLRAELPDEYITDIIDDLEAEMIEEWKI